MQNRFRSSLTGDLPDNTGGSYMKWVGIVVLLIIVGVGAYVYIPTSPAEDVGAVSANQIPPAGYVTSEQILGRLAQVMVLPAESNPLIRNVADVLPEIPNKALLSGSLETDKFIIYPESEKAIVFRPSTGQIVSIISSANEPSPTQVVESSVTTGSSTPGTSTTITTTVSGDGSSKTSVKDLRIEVRNGTTVNGAAKSTATKLESALGVKIAKTGPAANTEYKKMVIVNLTGKNVTEIEKLFGVKSNNALPDGEKPSTADALVIYGEAK